MLGRCMLFLYRSKLLRFCVVGASGLAVNMFIFYMLCKVAGFGMNLSAVCSFIAASLNNYTINTFWTFRSTKTAYTKLNYGKYLIANLIGLAVNIVVLNIVVYLVGQHSLVVAQLVAVLSATAFNFISSHKFVFKGR